MINYNLSYVIFYSTGAWNKIRGWETVLNDTSWLKIKTRFVHTWKNIPSAKTIFCRGTKCTSHPRVRQLFREMEPRFFQVMQRFRRISRNGYLYTNNASIAELIRRHLYRHSRRVIVKKLYFNEIVLQCYTYTYTYE